MGGIRAEPRTALIAQVRVSWEEQDGHHLDTPAKMEDTSHSGACIRIRKPIDVGTRLRVRSYREEFSGIARYCRRDGVDYILGIQRSKLEQAQTKPLEAVPIRITPVEIVKKISSPVPPEAAVELKMQPSKQVETLGTEIKQGPVPAKDPIPGPATISRAKVDPVAESKYRPAISEPKTGGASKEADVPTAQPSPGKERKSMSTKWFDLALKRQKPESPNVKAPGTSVPDERATAEPTPANHTPTKSEDKMPTNTQGDLQPLEDVYREAGILNPRRGYSISKVIEMLNNDHIRSLPDEAKKAAVLMALDAAGISVEEIKRDAQARQKALDAYEEGQRKRFEEYWSRKAEGNASIQSEMERATALALEHIKRNLDEVAAEKAEFEKWQAMKHQEVARITEAVALCSKQPEPEQREISLLALRETRVAAKPS
jgi:hypothetical protein